MNDKGGVGEMEITEATDSEYTEYTTKNLDLLFKSLQKNAIKLIGNGKGCGKLDMQNGSVQLGNDKNNTIIKYRMIFDINDSKIASRVGFGIAFTDHFNLCASEPEYYLFDMPIQNYLFNTKQSSNLITSQFYDFILSTHIPNISAAIAGDIGTLNGKVSLHSCQSQLLTTDTSDTVDIRCNNNNNGMNENVIVDGKKNRFSELFYSDFELHEIAQKFDLSLAKHIQKLIAYIVYNFKKLILLIPYAIGFFEDERFVSIRGDGKQKAQ